MAKTRLIPGFRFHPTDVELVMYFLKRKVMGKKLIDNVIAELDIYQYAPWDLPDKSCLRNGDLEWYFLCPIKKKYGSGARMNRATEIGYWKITGKDRSVQHNNHTVGMIKSLIFHTGKAPLGERTDWVMYEYRLDDKDLTDKGIAQDSYVICKVFQKKGRGPMNGAQYGRPFNEEDWNDEEAGIPFADSSAAPVPILPMASNCPLPNDQHLPPSGCIGSTSTSCLSGLIPSPGPSPGPEIPSHPSNQTVNNDDDILSMLDIFKEDMPEENVAEGAPSNDFFEDLGDLDYWAAFGGFSSGQNAEVSTNGMATLGDVGWFGDLEFMELIDLDSPLF
ncbi:NAC domain [Sesbania bispinosa]|nr:NAC domain [Sesbania bispinosa]